MDLKTLRAQLQRLAALADGWDDSREIPDIERDLVLEKLRALYDAVRFGLDSAVPSSVEDEPLPVDLPPVEIDLDAVIPLTAVTEPFGEDPVAAPSGEPKVVPPVIEPAVVDPSAVPVAAVSAVEPAEGPIVTPAEVPAEDAAPLQGAAAVEEEAPIAIPAEVPVEVPAETAVDAPVEEPAVAVEPVGEVPAEAVAAAGPAVTETTETAGTISSAVSPAVAAEPPVAGTLSLFELDPVDVKRAKHRVVLSLYGDAEPVASVAPARPASGAVEVEPVAAEQPVAAGTSLAADAPQEVPAAPVPVAEAAVHTAVPAESGSAVLGETLNADVKTVSDLMAVTVPPAAVGQEPVSDLRQALCNNDRFLLARDLFDGDMAACERTIDRLNEFDDLDECMIYITENFDWNPNSDGAKLLVDLIERKLA